MASTQNPYEPASEGGAVGRATQRPAGRIPIPVERLDTDDPLRPLPAVSPHGTTMPRHIAGIGDNLIAIIGAVVCAKQLPDSWVASQVVMIGVAYFGYFLLSESLFCTTPGKFLNGLVVRDFEGGRCSFRQTLTRTAFRLIEVNPAVLGFLPAAASILGSRDKQRFGDKVARTVVVFRRRQPARDAAS